MGAFNRGRMDVLLEIVGALLVAAFLVAVAMWTDDLLGLAQKHGVIPTMPQPFDRI